MIRGLLLAAALNASRNTRVGGFYYDTAFFKNAPQSYSSGLFVGTTCVGNASATITQTSNVLKSTPLTFRYSLPFDNSSFVYLDSQIRFRVVVVVYANNTGYTPLGLPRSEYYYLDDVVLTVNSNPNPPPDTNPDTDPDTNPDTDPDTNPTSNPNTNPTTNPNNTNPVNGSITTSPVLSLIVCLVFTIFPVIKNKW